MNFVKIFWIGISYLLAICVAVPLLSHEGLWYCSVRYDMFTTKERCLRLSDESRLIQFRDAFEVKTFLIGQG